MQKLSAKLSNGGPSRHLWKKGARYDRLIRIS